MTTPPKCEICKEPQYNRGLMCTSCTHSYDLTKNDGTVWCAMVWAANRARRTDRKRRGETKAAQVRARRRAAEEKQPGGLLRTG